MPLKLPLNLIRRKLTNLEMHELLKDAVSEKKGVEKGKKFEYFFENFMNQQLAFVYISKHCRSKVGEIDFFYRTELRDHPLWEKYPFLFIECKNWQEAISSEKMTHFIKLMESKNIFSCCGIYLTTSHFSKEAKDAIRDARMKGVTVIPIDQKDLSNLIEKGFRIFVQGRFEKILAKA